MRIIATPAAYAAVGGGLFRGGNVTAPFAATRGDGACICNSAGSRVLHPLQNQRFLFGRADFLTAFFLPAARTFFPLRAEDRGAAFDLRCTRVPEGRAS